MLPLNQGDKMIISPKEAIKKGWIKNVQNTEDQVQPNGLDFTVDSMYDINSHETFELYKNNNKVMRSTLPVHADEDDIWVLSPFSCFDFVSDLYIDVPSGVAATIIVRSTLNRNGIFITSGLYDSGYQGHVAGVLHNRSGEVRLQRGSKIGQVIFWTSQDHGEMYSGGYNHEEGTHWSDG